MQAKPLQEEFEIVLAQAWDDGCPVAGSTAEARVRLAGLAERRINSFARRNVPADDMARQVQDLAKGLASALERKPDLVGPLIEDYRQVARKLLEARSRV